MSSVQQWTALTIADPQDLVFGVTPKPLHCGFDLTIGNGEVYPEVNFTLPAISVDAEHWQEIIAEYRDMAARILKRALSLKVPGIVLEFELLPAMTDVPEWGAEITGILHQQLEEAHARHGLRCALRVTPTDLRDIQKPPLMRSGYGWERLQKSLELCTAAGADILSVESTGGKEVHDQALMYGDVPGMIFALGVLAPADMSWLWSKIAGICAGTRTVPGGDSACGFANTAMQLAHQKMLPEVLAAVVRGASAVRSLAAFEQGAVGPSKDCAYEGPILKAITGYPIAMEGKSASCAHFSPVGNIAAAACDLWSNESVQNVRLLSGYAPEAYTELLAYDCRLMNTATSEGGARTLRDWFVRSDEWRSPQAAVLSPEATIRIASAIVQENGAYLRTVAAAKTVVSIIREGVAAGRWSPAPKEAQWLDTIDAALQALPRDPGVLQEELSATYGAMFLPESYGLPARA